jgi:hypothetical protein
LEDIQALDPIFRITNCAPARDSWGILLIPMKKMVGPNGLEPSTSSVSRKRSNQTELRAYM